MAAFMWLLGGATEQIPAYSDTFGLITKVPPYIDTDGHFFSVFSGSLYLNSTTFSENKHQRRNRDLKCFNH